MNNFIKILGLLLVVGLMSCEDMEDSYSKYVDGGKIRYTGNCKNLTVETGWERCVLNWENSTDKLVDKIKVFVSTDEKTETFILPGDATTFNTLDSIEKLENKTYIFKLFAVDVDGNESLGTEAYARPFTAEHELIRSYSHIEQKHFYLKDGKVLIFLGEKRDGLYDPQIRYSSNETEIVKAISEEDWVKGVVFLDDVDVDSDISITRRADVENCLDVVDFEPYTLSRELISLRADMLVYLKGRHYITAANKSQLDDITDLYLDESLTSFVDLLYLSNLEKVVLGGKRYFPGSVAPPFDPEDPFGGMFDPFDPPGNDLELCELKESEKTISAIVLRILIQMGVTLEVHSDHYSILDELNPLLLMKGLPEVENLDSAFLPSNIESIKGVFDEWTVTVDTQEDGHDSHPEYLIDNDPSTVWFPLSKENKVRTHTIIIDMGEMRSFDGFLIRQTDDWVNEYSADLITIEISSNSFGWTNVLPNETRKLGRNKLEMGVVECDGSQTAQYIRVTTKDLISSRNNVKLADFFPVTIGN